MKAYFLLNKLAFQIVTLERYKQIVDIKIIATIFVYKQNKTSYDRHTYTWIHISMYMYIYVENWVFTEENWCVKFICILWWI